MSIDYTQCEHIVRSTKGHSYHITTIEDCDHIISALNERIHLAIEMDRLPDWVPIWRADIDQLLERRTYLSMLPDA